MSDCCVIGLEPRVHTGSQCRNRVGDEIHWQPVVVRALTVAVRIEFVERVRRDTGSHHAEQQPSLPLLHNYHRPEKPLNDAMAPTTRFRAAVQDAKIGPDKDIPHVTAPIIVKYIRDLHLLGLL
jgi:thioester reductase-like protein